VAVLLPVQAAGVDLVEPGELLDLGVDREAEVAQEVERVVMGRQIGAALHLAELVAPERELA